MTAHRFSQAIVAHRWLVMLGTLAWVAAVGYGGRFLSFNADSRVFFSADNPQLVALEAFENTYSREDYLLFVLAPREGDVFTREALAGIEELTEASWQVPYSSRIDSIANHQHIEAEADDLLVFPLVRNAASLSDADIERVRDIALGSPRLAGRLLNPPWWWHSVRNATPQSIGISTRWEAPYLLNDNPFYSIVQFLTPYQTRLLLHMKFGEGLKDSLLKLRIRER